MNVHMAWMTGNLGGLYDKRFESKCMPARGGVIDAPASVRISSVGGGISTPQRRLLRDPWMEEFEAEKIKKKQRADKWAKRLKAIKAILHKIKEKLKE